MSDVAQAGGAGDFSSVPASAFPEGANPAEYVQATTNVSPSAPPLSDPVAAARTARPEGVPEKFWDAEKGVVRTDALLKSYTELEKGRTAPADAAVEAPAAPPADDGKPTLERPDDAAAKADPEASPVVDEKAAALTAAVTSIAERYAANGDLADDDYSALETAGLPRNFVENYVRGVKALEQASLQSAHDAAGGKDVFEAAKAWAAKDLSDGDFAFYNDNVSDPRKAASAVEWMVNKYKAAVPTEGRLVTGATQATTSGDVYRSTAQMQSDMTNPLYKTDPAFREVVAAKLLRSREAGTLQSTTTYYKGGR